MPRDITRLLERSREGDPCAAEELIALLYEQLRSLAARYMDAERAGHTLQATALVHEAYLRLSGGATSWEGRAHFFGAAATALRRILVEHARSRRARREHEPAPEARIDVAELPAGGPADHVLAVDAAVGRLGEINPLQARMVELRFFGGMTTEEIAAVLGSSPRTVARDWVQAKAWLTRELRRDGVVG